MKGDMNFYDSLVSEASKGVELNDSAKMLYQNGPKLLILRNWGRLVDQIKNFTELKK